ncbi:hypothetical protein GYMLUDRAFT_239525 [Collybiopsis luxurians FD-317 M1]|nr:hypothetical protein GYMLUDRAFT_239525 [Collybiopsis luxurians FD-317 M1]
MAELMETKLDESGFDSNISPDQLGQLEQPSLELNGDVDPAASSAVTPTALLSATPPPPVAPAVCCSACLWMPSVDLLHSQDTIKGGGEIQIPKSYADAMKNPEDWIPPMKAEIESLVK